MICIIELQEGISMNQNFRNMLEKAKQEIEPYERELMTQHVYRVLLEVTGGEPLPRHRFEFIAEDIACYLIQARKVKQ